MFHLDNGSGIDVMPPQKQTISRQQKWFTEGDTQTPPSYPGADWFNIVQAELLNVLKDGGITPSKSELSQLSAAIRSIINKNQIKINDASLISKGVVQLNSATDSTIENQAATPKAVHDTFKYVRFTNQKAQSAYDHASSAHNRIDPIVDKFQPSAFETRTYSQDKRFYHLVRDDGIVGMYSLVKNGFSWYINHDGWINGYITADKIGGLDQFVRDRTPPVGVPMPWPQHYPPAGYFECNGSTFDKNKYSKLAAAYPLGKLPDLRGEFIRGWDNARGADPYRVILEWQAPQVSAHRHVGAAGENSTTFAEWQHEHHAPFGKTGISGVWGGLRNGDFDNPLLYTNDGTPGGITTSRGTTHWNDLNPAGLVGNETRPRNIAFMYIVKAE